MVIGERFAWAHLPKTGGMATERMFRLFPRLVVFADPDDTDEKHSTFRARRRMLDGKLLAMNLRRLPFWVLSRAQYVSREGVWPKYEPIPMAPAQELAESSFPDSRIHLYTDDGRFVIERWLRTEFLPEDFLRFVSEFTDVSEGQRKAVNALGPVNAQEYDHRLEEWFTAAQVRTMYEHNPAWAAIEEELYGGLVELEAP
jgi:hypothetical protein